MAYPICLEEIEGRWIAHVMDLPGCFATRQDRDTAIAAIPKTVQNHLTWLQERGIPAPSLVDPPRVEEIIRSWESSPDYEVSAFFAFDSRPISLNALLDYERLLSATRHDLLQTIEALNPDELTRTYPGERWSIEGILDHVANAEWWYMDRMGLAPEFDVLPADHLERLSIVRQHLIASLPDLAKKTEIVTLSGETWSSRKVLRRALWHERDHTQHIAKLCSS